MITIIFYYNIQYVFPMVNNLLLILWFPLSPSFHEGFRTFCQTSHQHISKINKDRNELVHARFSDFTQNLKDLFRLTCLPIFVILRKDIAQTIENKLMGLYFSKGLFGGLIFWRESWNLQKGYRDTKIHR